MGCLPGLSATRWRMRLPAGRITRPPGMPWAWTRRPTRWHCCPAAGPRKYAACADETRANATDDPEFTARLLEWYGKPGGAALPSVKIAPANFYGVRALHGYVWEWVGDFNNSMVTGESRGDSGIDRKLYCAGGALGATDTRNYAAFMRYAFRSSLKGNYTVPNLGFRGARDADPSKKDQ